MKYRIGVDIGGMSVKIGVVDSEFNVAEKHRFATGPKVTVEFIVNGIVEICRKLCDKYPIESIGIGSPGRVDSEKGIVVRAGNLPFRNEPLAEKIYNAVGVPTYIENDGSCALIGEVAAGVCKGCTDAVIITIGTGIGGAIVLNGKLVRGAKCGAGELGHFVIDRNGEECACGLKGCFEQYASATALIEQTEKAIAENPDSILASCGREEVTGKTVFDALELHCPVAIALLDEYGKILADGINSLVHIFQPQMVAVSGGIANQGKTLMSLVTPYLLPDADVATTALNGDGGIIGAALLGTEHSC